MKTFNFRIKAAALPRRLGLLALLLILTGLLVTSSGELIGLQSPPTAFAQDNWTMPWDEPRVRRRSRKRRQVRRQPSFGGRSAICLRLERQLVQDSTRGSGSKSALPRINRDIRRYERLYARASSKLDRAQCYDTFLFIKTLRQSRKCRRLERRADDAKKRMRQLEAKRREIKGGGRRNKSYQNEIISSLARNNCGANYQREARRRENANNPFSSAFWQDGEDTGPAPRLRYGALPFATYKTVCVRLCDGYYFPVSFSTLPSHFKRDINVCQSRCAAPADLYYYQNPGGAVEQMVSATQQTPYTKLPMAWRYRKEYVRGCSCKQTEYNPLAGDPKRKADAGGFQTTTKQRLTTQ